MTYGYCRISTKKQNIERQERNIKETYLLNEPVDLQQIDYVKIGEKEFKF